MLTLSGRFLNWWFLKVERYALTHANDPHAAPKLTAAELLGRFGG